MLRRLPIALLLYISIITILSSLDIRAYVTIRRITIYQPLTLNFPLPAIVILLPLSIMSLYALSIRQRVLFTLLFILIHVSAFVYNVYWIAILLSIAIVIFPILKDVDILRELIVLCIFLHGLLSAYSLIMYIIYGVTDGSIYSNGGWAPAIVGMYLYYYLQGVYLPLMLIIPYITLTSIYMYYNNYKDLLQIKGLHIKLSKKKFFSLIPFAFTEKILGNNRNVNLVLYLSILISLVSSIYPILPTINPGFNPVGVDVKYFYKPWIEKVLSGDPLIMSFRVAEGSRPLYMLILYLLINMGFSVEEVLNCIIVPLLPLLVFSVYYMVYRISGRKDLAALSSFFTATGYQVTVGIYSAFHASILALSLMYVFLGIVIDGWRSKREKMLALLIVFVANLIHPWTVVHSFAVAFIYLVLLFLYNVKYRDMLSRLLLSMVPLALSELIKAYFKSYGVIGASYSVIRGGDISLDNVWRFVREMHYATTRLYGGFIDFPLLILVFICIPFIVFFKRTGIFSYSWLASAIVLMFSNSVAQTRIYFNIPIGLLSAQSVIILSNILYLKKRMFLLSIMLISLEYLFRCLANLGYLTW